MEEKLKGLEIPVSPKKIDCLAWSDDGELAVAAGPDVYILLPRRSGPSQEASLDTERSPWHQLRFGVGAFTREEWPEAATQGIYDFSIGKEQALVDAVAVAWSAPGLAGDGRCSLAVLTSNYLLSVWSPTFDPSVDRNWRRVWVANRKVGGNIEGIVAMAWSPALDGLQLQNERRSPGSPSMQRYESHYLAVMSEYGDTIIHQLSYAAETAFGVLKTTICASDSPSDLQAEATNGLLRSRISDKELRKFDHLSQSSSMHAMKWSEWKYAKDKKAAKNVLLWKFYGKYKVLQIDCEYIKVSIISLSLICRIRMSSTKHHPENDFGSGLFFPKADELGQRRRLNGRFGSIRNHATQTWNQPLHTCPLRSSSTAPIDMLLTASHQNHITLLELRHVSQSEVGNSKHGNQRQDYTHLARPTELGRRIAKLGEKFQAQHEYHRMLDIRVWGLASWGSFVAACVTLHPSNQLQYKIASKENSYIVFTDWSWETKKAVPPGADTTGYVAESFPWELEPVVRPPYEAHTGMNWPGENPDKHVGLAPLRLNRQLLLVGMISSFLRLPPGRGYAEHTKQLLDKLAPYNYLPDFQLFQGYLTGEQDHHQNRHTKEAPAAAPESQATALLRRINAYIDARAAQEAAALAASAAAAEPRQQKQARFLEYCTIEGCAAPVRWSSEPTGAVCATGHVSARCSLTGLAFMDPYLCKRCETCQKPYLDRFQLARFYDEAELAGMITHEQRVRPLRDGRVGEREAGDEGGKENSENAEEEREGDGDAQGKLEDEGETDELDVLLRQALACIYCGGKFIRQAVTLELKKV